MPKTEGVLLTAGLPNALTGFPSVNLTLDSFVSPSLLAKNVLFGARMHLRLSAIGYTIVEGRGVGLEPGHARKIQFFQLAKDKRSTKHAPTISRLNNHLNALEVCGKRGANPPLPSQL
jgi:hypothetical protein